MIPQRNIDLAAIQRSINYPDRIISLAHLELLIQSDDCYSVVEKGFYDAVPAIFQNLQKHNIPGDIVVAGVWKGGSSLYLRALEQYYTLHKKLWLIDTFQGFVRDSIQHEKDRQALAMFSTMLAPDFPTASSVQALFVKHDLWQTTDIAILEGDLAHTLPTIDASAYALVHIDVDFYEPTQAALELTYPKLSLGGYVIIDDYGVEMFNCRDAVDDFRGKYGITESLHFMTNYVAYWKKEHHV